jgi:predicted anti-sigma-YlaC factor YlaD
MTTTTQHIAPEDIMALLDGELAAAEARTVAEHMERCAECGAIAEQFRETSRALAAWAMPSLPEALETVIREKSAKRIAQGEAKIPLQMGFRGGAWRWAIGGGCVVTMLVLFAMFHSEPLSRRGYVASPMRAEVGGFAMKAAPSPAAGPVARTQSQFYDYAASANMAALRQVVPGLPNPPAVAATAPGAAAPMIARTVSLTIQVKDITGSRQALDAILTRYQGYTAELTINTPEGSARSFSASLRIPAPALPASLADLRNLGRIQNESQSGEELTQQHADLVARLRNARETEQRLLAILQQRTGKVEEVLQVEEQISDTRGEIERMEAEQKALEHRVDFATVQLQLGEEYQAQLGTPSTSVGTRMRNAFVSGLENAGSNVLGMILFFEEFGPVLLLWVVLLGMPAWFLWRRYRNAQSRI